MNFVHFPKLNDYALEPELVSEPSEYGLEVTKTNRKSAISPHNQDGCTSQRPLQDKYTREDCFQSEAGCDTPHVTTVNFSDSPSPCFEESDQDRERTNNTKDEIDNNGYISGYPRIQFFRRYDHISLPAEGLDFSDPAEDKSRNVGQIHNNDMTTTPIILDQRILALKGNQSTTVSGRPYGLAMLTSPTMHVERLPHRVNERWPDKGHFQNPKAKAAQSSDMVIQISTNPLPIPGLKTTATKSNTNSKGMYLQKFKRVSLAVVNVLKLAKVIIKRTDSPSALLKTFTALSREPEEEEESENMKNYGLQFDLSYFRANKEITISSEVKNILRLPPSHRTPEQIQTAMFGLQSLPSFAEYPLHMQEKLTKVAWYEIVTPQRTIIRQGHFAENFYFILSGQAVVTIHKPGETSAQTAAIMRKGTSFGELALLHHSRRTATVTSHDTVQLLSVGREDFFDIFMSGHRKGEIPEHIQFISQLDFMKDWPLERLLERPDQCLLHFFKRNMVIVRDSKISDWFYVVKSGSCQVLKQLKRVNGNIGQPRKQSLAGPGSRGRHVTRAWQPELEQNTRRQLHTKKRPRKLTEANKSDNSWPDSPDASDTDSDTATNSPGKPEPREPYTSRPSASKPRLNQPADVSKNLDARLLDKQQTQLPVFVQIELLKPKDVFGLDLVTSSLDSNPTSVSLVSLGAECVMLSKAFFIKHARDSMRKRFAEIIQPYPDEDTLQDSLQTKVNWELYKRSLILQVTASKLTSTGNSTNALSYYKWQPPN